MLNYKKEIPEMTDLLALYSSVGWTNYTNNPTMLEEAVKASLWQLAVYDEEELVAYIRLVGDGHSVLLVQDLLVRPDHQRQGIGKKLLEEALATFPNVYQRLLVTERSEKNLALENKDYQGIRVFYALQDNRFKDQEGWRESMLKMELAVCQESPYRDIAFFQHYRLKRS